MNIRLGQHRSIESAVRMNILTSVNQTSGKLQELRAEELGWDLVEVSAHGGARPEHAEWQGKVYSLRGLTKGYKTLEEGCDYGSVTGLCGVNCRHTFFPYYKGSTLTYTNKELNQLKNETVNYNGKDISKYEASQIQRKLERQIRQDKKDIAGLQGILTSDTKDSKLIEETNLSLANTKIKLSQHNSALNDFIDQTGFKKDNNRLFTNPKYTNKDIPEYKSAPLHKGERIYKEKEIYEIANATKQLSDKYTINESKWSGKLTFSNRQINAKLWSCNIEIERMTSTHNLLHEQLHAHSISYYDRATYLQYKNIEEATVEFYTREICKKENIEITKSETDYYDKLTSNLYKINNMLKVKNTDFEFAQELFNKPVTERLEYLEDLAYEYQKNASVDDGIMLNKLIGELYGK